MIRRGRAGLHELLGEVADIDWRHPAWWLLLGGTALLERLAAGGEPAGGEDYGEWLSANGGPRTDTFMACEGPAAPPPAAERVARAVVRARVAAETLARPDLSFPGQPLERALAWQDGWLRRVELPTGPPRVVFLLPRGRFLAALQPGREAALARALGAALAERPFSVADLAPLEGSAPAPAAVAVSLDEQPRERARHIHRQAWTAGGGPWLGLGDAAGLQLLTTCHLVVDGFGHARVSDVIFRAVNAASTRALAAAAAEGLAGREPPRRLAPPVPGAEPMGFAARHVALDAPATFPRLAYAFGRALEGFYRQPGGRARRSPTFQVPLATGRREDLLRRQRRVLIALFALHLRDGGFEPYPEFRARLGPLLERETASAGLLSRILVATARAPLPDALRRRLLATRGLPHPWLPPIEVLGGRGCLSSLRLDPDPAPAAPLYAASSPSLVATRADGRGGLVLTLIHHPGSLSASVCGTGTAATEEGAGAFLDAWLDELARVPVDRTAKAVTA